MLYLWRGLFNFMLFWTEAFGKEVLIQFTSVELFCANDSYAWCSEAAWNIFALSCFCLRNIPFLFLLFFIFLNKFDGCLPFIFLWEKKKKKIRCSRKQTVWSFSSVHLMRNNVTYELRTPWLEWRLWMNNLFDFFFFVFVVGRLVLNYLFIYFGKYHI